MLFYMNGAHASEDILSFLVDFENIEDFQESRTIYPLKVQAGSLEQYLDSNTWRNDLKKVFLNYLKYSPYRLSHDEDNDASITFEDVKVVEKSENYVKERVVRWLELDFTKDRCCWYLVAAKKWP